MYASFHSTRSVAHAYILNKTNAKHCLASLAERCPTRVHVLSADAVKSKMAIAQHVACAFLIIDDFLMESDDSDEDDSENDILVTLLATAKIRRSLVPKVVGFVEEVVTAYSDVDFRADFRLFNNRAIIYDFISLFFTIILDLSVALT